MFATLGVDFLEKIKQFLCRYNFKWWKWSNSVELTSNE